MTHTPFNGDRFIGIELRKLIARFGVRHIIETGTWSAHSTREFRTMVPGRIITIDPTYEHLFAEFGAAAVDDLNRQGISAILGDSSKILETVLRWCVPLDPTLIYLDAHGGGANKSNVNPILEELDAIGRVPGVRLVAIHDFQVPGKPWGYNGGDWGRGFEPLSYELIQPQLAVIFPSGHGYHYNDEAEGCQRGIIYVYPNA